MKNRMFWHLCLWIYLWLQLSHPLKQRWKHTNDLLYTIYIQFSNNLWELSVLLYMKGQYIIIRNLKDEIKSLNCHNSCVHTHTHTHTHTCFTILVRNWWYFLSPKLQVSGFIFLLGTFGLHNVRKTFYTHTAKDKINKAEVCNVCHL